MPRIIGFCHKAQVGKDTAANYLAKVYGFQHESFAEALKEHIGSGLFGLSSQQMEDPKLKEAEDPRWDMTPRQILQRGGTALRNAFGDNFWVWCMYYKINKNPTTYNYAISDVRYREEAEWIKSANGILIKLNRNTSGTASQHQSEIDLDSWNAWDEVIDNNGTLEELYAKLDLVVRNHILNDT